MANRKAFFITAALALAAILFVPDGTFARGAGGFAGRGPVFGFHPRIAVPRPFRPIVRVPTHFAWQLRWWKERRARHRSDTSAVYPAADGGSPDVTGTVPIPVFVPPAVPPAPPEPRIGCFTRGYDVPGELGGVARVTVTRC